MVRFLAGAPSKDPNDVDYVPTVFKPHASKLPRSFLKNLERQASHLAAANALIRLRQKGKYRSVSCQTDNIPVCSTASQTDLHFELTVCCNSADGEAACSTVAGLCSTEYPVQQLLCG
jgi:hypothetical protein